MVYSKKQKKEMKEDLRSIFWCGLLIIPILIVMFFINRWNITTAGEFRAESAVEDYIAEEKGIESWEVDVVLMDKSTRRVETDPRRELYANTSGTMEVTYTFKDKSDAETYEIIALIENKNDGGVLADWNFYKIVSVK